MINREALQRPFAPHQIRRRQGLWGDVLDYVEGVDYIERLNEAFEFVWSFQVLEYRVYDEEVVVLGQLQAAGMVKQQFGRSRITRRRDGGEILSLGDDLKAAATDSLKKCASLLGIGLHLYRGGDVPRTRTSPNGRRSGERLTARQLSAIAALARRQGLTGRAVNALVKELFDKSTPDELSQEEAARLIEHLQAS